MTVSKPYLMHFKPSDANALPLSMQAGRLSVADVLLLIILNIKDVYIVIRNFCYICIAVV